VAESSTCPSLHMYAALVNHGSRDVEARHVQPRKTAQTKELERLCS